MVGKLVGEFGGVLERGDKLGRVISGLERCGDDDGIEGGEESGKSAMSFMDSEDDRYGDRDSVDGWGFVGVNLVDRNPNKH